MLGRDTDDDYLKQVFSPYGLVEEATVLRLPDGTSKGCAFIKFSSNAEAINAIAALHNRVTVEVSDPSVLGILPVRYLSAASAVNVLVARCVRQRRQRVHCPFWARVCSRGSES